MTTKGETLTSYLAWRYSSIPENVHIVPAESNASPFIIADHAKGVVVWTSSLAWEMAYYGYPVIVAGWAACSNHIGYPAYTAKDYWKYVYDAMEGKLSGNPEWKQEAIRYKAIVEGRCWIDLSHLIGNGGVNDFAPKWAGGWAALTPGADPVVDMICDGIENGKPFYWPK
jgi:hypothetical protein